MEMLCHLLQYEFIQWFEPAHIIVSKEIFLVNAHTIDSIDDGIAYCAYAQYGYLATMFDTYSLS